MPCFWLIRFGSAFQGRAACSDGRKFLLKGKRKSTWVETISKLCGVSRWAPPFWQKVDLNFELCDWVM